MLVLYNVLEGYILITNKILDIKLKNVYEYNALLHIEGLVQNYCNSLYKMR